MGKETESQWQVNLDEARKILSEVRTTLILSWLMIHSTDDNEERKTWGKIWGQAVREEIATTKDLIAPAKIGLGLPLTNIDIERGVIRRAKEISEMCGGTIEEGEEIATRHIEVTKRIQRRLGVEDYSSAP